MKTFYILAVYYPKKLATEFSKEISKHLKRKLTGTLTRGPEAFVEFSYITKIDAINAQNKLYEKFTNLVRCQVIEIKSRVVN